MTDYLSARPLRSPRRLANLSVGGHCWYRIDNLSEDSPAVVSIFDEIGVEAVSSSGFLNDLRGLGNRDIELHLNSPGGDVFEGIAIYNTLRQHKGTVSVVVDGLAASAASFIAQAASPGKLEIAPHAQMMIHNGFAMAVGDARDMRKTADLLDKVTGEIAAIYAERTGRPRSYWLNKMADETWLTSSEAVAEGLADRVHGQDGPTAGWDLSVYGRYSNAAADNGWMMRHGEWVFDPMDDGDDDYQASTDVDHDYWDEAGNQLKSIPAGPPGSGKPAKPMKKRNKAAQRFWNAKYQQADRDRMASSGEAMPDGSYPIADREDLDNAIHAVGRGGADHDAIRRHIIKRAKALGASEAIPDNWNSDGSLKSAANEFDPGLLSAALTTALGGVNA